MVSHSRSSAIDSIYLLSGDDDLTEAVEEAQAQGVQVTVLAVPTSGGLSHGVSKHLLRAADGMEIISEQTIADTVAAVTIPSAGPHPAPPKGDTNVAPHVPNPADVARHVTAPPLSTVAYSSGPGAAVYIAPEHLREPQELTATIDEVVRRAYDAWAATATPAQRDELLTGRPSIPRDLDRALLFDLSAALGDDNDILSDPVRFRLRARFWDVTQS